MTRRLRLGRRALTLSYRLKMRVLVDYRPALRARTGVGEYMHELVRAYTTSHPADDVAVFTSSWADRPAPGTAETLHARVVDRRVPVAVLNLLWHRAEWPPWNGSPAKPTWSTRHIRCSFRPRVPPAW
jgi:hypothetical protein